METKQPQDVTIYEKNYSESGFWDKAAKVAKKAGGKAIYCALILYYILKSDEVSTKDKALIMGALGYFILPVDLIPDAIPVVGFTDDVAALVGCYMAVKANVTPEIEAQAQAKYREWFDTEVYPEL